MAYWRSRENSLCFRYGMKGQHLLPLCAQTGFSLEKPIELAEALGVYTWVSYIFKAYQLVLSRMVAVKVLSPALAAEPGFTASFQQEAYTLVRLNHPHSRLNAVNLCIGFWTKRTSKHRNPKRLNKSNFTGLQC